MSAILTEVSPNIFIHQSLPDLCRFWGERNLAIPKERSKNICFKRKKIFRKNEKFSFTKSYGRGVDKIHHRK